MIRRLLKYALLFSPAGFLVGLLALLVIAAWISALLNNVSRFETSPRLIQGLTRSVYVSTRTIWQSRHECVEFDADTLYRPRPGNCRFSNAEFDTSMHFDALGIRVTAVPQMAASEYTSDKPRIIVLGDSQAMGWGVEDNDTFASQLALTHGYETINLGVSSYGTARELSRLTKAVTLRPNDVIVIQYSDNDLGENKHLVSSGRMGPYSPEHLRKLLSHRHTPASTLHIAGMLLRIVSGRATSAVARLLGRQQALLSAHSTNEQPAMILAKVLRMHRTLLEHRVFVVAINWRDNYSHLEPGRKHIDAIGAALLVPQLNEDHFFRIDDHMNPTGHRLVADLIAQAVERDMLSDHIATDPN